MDTETGDPGLHTSGRENGPSDKAYDDVVEALLQIRARRKKAGWECPPEFQVEDRDAA